MKRRELLNQIIKEQIFGIVVAHVCVNEFQKIGLSHSHIILILDEPSKSSLRNPENVDKLISAEIPDEDVTDLGEQVLKHMIHRPCSGNPNSVCRKHGGNSSCSKSFPKRFRQATGSMKTNYYVEYQRRGPDYGGETGSIRVCGEEVQVDNRLVVPHSPELLRIFQGHMNFGSIKYLFKYVCKGSARVSIQFTEEGQDVNEID